MPQTVVRPIPIGGCGGQTGKRGGTEQKWGDKDVDNGGTLN